MDRNPPTTDEVCDTPITNNYGGTNSPTQYIDTIAWCRPAVCGRNVVINIKVTIVRLTIKLNPLNIRYLNKTGQISSFLNIFCLLLYDYFYCFVRISQLFIHFVSKLCSLIQVHKKSVPCIGYRYRGTDYVQQKKQYNQTINPQENSVVWFLWFFHDDGTCRNTHKIWHKST